MEELYGGAYPLVNYCIGEGMGEQYSLVNYCMYVELVFTSEVLYWGALITSEYEGAVL